MKNKYIVEVTKECARDLKRYTKKNYNLRLEFNQRIKILSKDPFNPILATHTVNISSFGRVYSSRISSDFRVIWIFKSDQIILLHRFGGHSGSSNVYR
ncbi:MAG: hypothetical protein PHP08_04285 [Candidatus Dojkabacteria bacterium]|nr:hypothetical protein [Candidatus Dojkabacteria bacterium]